MRYLLPVLVATASILGSAPVQADVGDQLAKFLPDDGDANDRFGYSVAISVFNGKTTALVGASDDDVNGPYSGSAYLFDMSDMKNPIQLFKLIPDDGVESHHFAHSVAISSTTAVIGAPGDNENGTDTGAVYLFDIVTGQQISKLMSDDADTVVFFGASVAVSGEPGSEIAIIGAPYGQGIAAWTGTAYLFDIATGKQLFKLQADDGAYSDRFGVAVDIGGNIAIVGAHEHGDNGTRSGSAYLFDTTTGQQITELLPDDGSSYDFFGITVASSGTTAVVGSWNDDDNGSNSGSAYTFDTTTGQQIHKLLPDDGQEGDHFGIELTIGGAPGDEIILVGSYLDDDNGFQAGSAYLFDAPTGQQITKIMPEDGEEWDLFGYCLDISGAPGEEIAIAGSLQDGDNGIESGSAYIFDLSGFPCPWDLDSSGAVGTGDLLALFAQWGTNGPADFDESGAVGTGDLLILFANWGPCE